MPNPATVRQQRLRKTKAQLIDELETLDQRTTDITVRKRAEADLAEKEAQLHLALDQMRGGIKLVDRDLNYVLVNPQYSEICGYPAGLAKVGGSMLDELRFQAERGDYGPGDAGEAMEEVLAFYRRGEAARWERTLANGRTVEVHVAPTPEGGYVNILTDITERKAAEDEVQENRERLQALTDNLPEFISMKDLEGRFLFVNKRFEEWVCVDRNDVIGKTVYDIYPDEQAIEFDALDREAIDSQKVSSRNIDLIYPDGNARAIIGIRFPVISSEGEVLGLGTVNHDVTNLKQVERELAEKEALLRLSLDNMTDGIYVLDSRLRYLTFNDHYLELLGVSYEEIQVGKPVRSVVLRLAQDGFYGPGDPKKLTDDRMALFANDDYVEIEVTTKSDRILHVRKAPLEDGGAVITMTDITERKRAEEALAEKEAQLRLALDHMPGCIVLGDRDLNYVLFSADYSELFDFPDGLVRVGGSLRDELRYQADRGDFGPGDKGDLIEQVVAPRLRGEAVSYERAIAGSGRTLQVNVAPTPQGGYVLIATDITERKRAEQELAEAKRRSEEASKLVAEKNQMLESLSNQLSKYLSPQVYASIFSGDQSVEIASKRKKLTIFFSDIADFTGTTDSLESEELTNLLNHYLTEMSKIALDHGATIDKYVGDSIIAFFGDPETRGVKEDARSCVNMAIAMQRRMQGLQSEWLDVGLERPFQQRIGINTGFCTVGNFGSKDRMDYTIIGNEVNLAARLESLAEVGGILMAHETHSLVKDTVMAEEGDTLTVKGFVKPVRTYGVVGLYDDLAEQGRIIRKEQDGVRVLVDLEKGDKADAIQAIEDVLSQLKG